MLKRRYSNGTGDRIFFLRLDELGQGLEPVSPRLFLHLTMNSGGFFFRSLLFLSLLKDLSSYFWRRENRRAHEDKVQHPRRTVLTRRKTCCKRNIFSDIINEHLSNTHNRRRRRLEPTRSLIYLRVSREAERVDSVSVSMGARWWLLSCLMNDLHFFQLGSWVAQCPFFSFF